MIMIVSRMLSHEMGWETPWDATDEIAGLTRRDGLSSRIANPDGRLDAHPAGRRRA